MTIGKKDFRVSGVVSFPCQFIPCAPPPNAFTRGNHTVVYHVAWLYSIQSLGFEPRGAESLTLIESQTTEF